MKRYISLLLALLLMVGLLAGCGNTEEKPSTEPSTSTTTDPTQAPDDGNDPTEEPSDEFPLPLTEDEVTFDYWLPNSMTFEGYSEARTASSTSGWSSRPEFTSTSSTRPRAA